MTGEPRYTLLNAGDVIQDMDQSYRIDRQWRHVRHDMIGTAATSDVLIRRADLPAQDSALGWMAAREAAASAMMDFAAVSKTFGDNNSVRPLVSAATAIRAMDAPTSAQLLAEAMRLPEIAGLALAMRGIYRRMDYPQHFDPVINELAGNALAAIKDASHD